MRIFLRSLLSAFIFTTLWSSWAYYANSSFGETYAIKAAITQGSFTFINSFIYTVILEFLLNRFKKKNLIIAFLIPNVLLSIILPLLHILRDTPNVSYTVIPVLIIIYIISGLYLISRRKN